jgi:cytoskeletal protein CcmA (bactofilin family)
MFSKNKDAVPAAPSAAQAALATPKRPGRNSAPSIISADLTVTGTLVSNGDIQIEGIVEGDVRSAGLVIGEKAQIRGEIQADDITVRGRVVGRIHGRKIQLAATSHVEGEILHEAFSVEAGAFFEGNCRHSANPLGDVTQKPVARPQGAPTQQTALGVARTGLAGLAPQPAE